MIVHQVPQNVPPMPLLRYLQRAYPLLSVRPLLKKRDVRLNGQRVGEKQADTAVRPGDEIALYAEPDFSLRIVGEEDGLLAVIKPQGLPVDADSDGIAGDTALTRARLLYPEAQLCHRLDAQTGGVLLLATEPDACERALKAFREHQVSKSYAALTGGRYGSDSGTYRDYLVKDAGRAEVRIVGGGKNALPVETRWRVVEKKNDKLTLMDLEPVTGRTHQLRAHMAHYGHPILGDDRYGDRALNREFRASRLCLWCRSIRILGHSFTAEAPDWNTEEKTVGRHSTDGL